MRKGVNLLIDYLGGDLERLVQSIVRGTYKPIPTTFSSSIAELIKVMLRPEAARRPTIAQVIMDLF